MMDGSVWGLGWMGGHRGGGLGLIVILAVVVIAWVLLQKRK